MIKLNKADQEILSILKVLFFTKNIKPLSSDEHFRIWFVRAALYVSLFTLSIRLSLVIAGELVSTTMSAIFNLPLTIFFTVLFLYINQKSENTSLIIFMLTWLALVIGLYI